MILSPNCIPDEYIGVMVRVTMTSAVGAATQKQEWSKILQMQSNPGTSSVVHEYPFVEECCMSSCSSLGTE